MQINLLHQAFVYSVYLCNDLEVWVTLYQTLSTYNVVRKGLYLHIPNILKNIWKIFLNFVQRLKQTCWIISHNMKLEFAEYPLHISCINISSYGELINEYGEKCGIVL